jgi:hypothetical protein
VYAQSVRVAEVLPELLPHLELKLLDGRRLEHGHSRLWIGSGSHHAAPHFDLPRGPRRGARARLRPRRYDSITSITRAATLRARRTSLWLTE